MTVLADKISEHLLDAYNDANEIITKFHGPKLFFVKLYYALSKIEPKYGDQFRKASLENGFWEGEQIEVYSCADELFYVIKLELPDKGVVDEVINSYLLDIQNRHGYIPSEHAKGLRAIISYDKKSNHTLLALKYLLEWIEQGEFRTSKYDMVEVPYAMLALMELDFEKYKPIISDLADSLIEKQSSDGSISFGESNDEIMQYSVRNTSHCIVALCRFLGSSNQHVISAVNYVTKNRPETGWNHIAVSDVMIALIEAGHGLKIPESEAHWQNELMRQKHKQDLPTFLHTSPIYGGKLHVKDIYSKIIEMLQTAEREILIVSLYVDMFYEELINLAERDLSIRVIMRPARDAKGLRERINKNVIELLKIATKGNTRINEICHTRMIIVDSNQVLVSSVDLTRDQLYDEFNAGIWTRNPETVRNALEFFENLWRESDQLTS